MKRLITDLDGMIEDLKERYYDRSIEDLVADIIELKYGGSDDNDIIEDWQSFCNGEIISKNDSQLLTDLAMELKDE